MVSRDEAGGYGARVHEVAMKEGGIGIGWRQIQEVINNDKVQRRIRSSFKNKPKLNPVTATAWMDTLQGDLMDFNSKPCKLNGKEYRYILVLIDLFSR